MSHHIQLHIVLISIITSHSKVNQTRVIWLYTFSITCFIIMKIFAERYSRLMKNIISLLDCFKIKITKKRKEKNKIKKGRKILDLENRFPFRLIVKIIWSWSMEERESPRYRYRFLTRMQLIVLDRPSPRNIQEREVDLIGDSSSHEIEAGDCSPRDA